MKPNQKPLQIMVYQDALCAWCYVAESRIEVLKREFGDSVRWLRRPFPLRPQDVVPSDRDRLQWLKEVAAAQLEPEGKKLTPELWNARELPRSSVPALAALEAARLQGREAHDALFHSLQRAGLEQGVNITRSDVIFELASGLGLEMNRFCAAFGSPETRRLIAEEHKLASERGVKGAPTLVIAGKWMLSGLRDISEYREQILSCLHKVDWAQAPASDRVLH